MLPQGFRPRGKGPSESICLGLGHGSKGAQLRAFQLSFVNSLPRETRPARTRSETHLLPGGCEPKSGRAGSTAGGKPSPASSPGEGAGALSFFSRSWSSSGGACAHAPIAPVGKKSRGSRRKSLPFHRPRGWRENSDVVSVSAASSFFRSSRKVHRRGLRLQPGCGTRQQSWRCLSR